jgi:hypothetical protein
MRGSRARVLAAIALAVLLAVAAGCGGGGKKAASTTGAGAAATAAATAESSVTQSSTVSSSVLAIASAANCRQLEGLSKEFAQALSGTAGDDPKKIADLLHQFASKTPSDIRPDFVVVADAYAKIADAIGSLKLGQTPDASALSKLKALSTSIDQERVTKAWQHISVWAKKNCKP